MLNANILRRIDIVLAGTALCWEDAARYHRAMTAVAAAGAQPIRETLAGRLEELVQKVEPNEPSEWFTAALRKRMEGLSALPLFIMPIMVAKADEVAKSAAA